MVRVASSLLLLFLCSSTFLAQTALATETFVQIHPQSYETHVTVQLWPSEYIEEVGRQAYVRINSGWQAYAIGSDGKFQVDMTNGHRGFMNLERKIAHFRSVEIAYGTQCELHGTDPITNKISDACVKVKASNVVLGEDIFVDLKNKLATGQRVAQTMLMRQSGAMTISDKLKEGKEYIREQLKQHIAKRLNAIKSAPLLNKKVEEEHAGHLETIAKEEAAKIIAKEIAELKTAIGNGSHDKFDAIMTASTANVAASLNVKDKAVGIHTKIDFKKLEAEQAAVMKSISTGAKTTIDAEFGKQKPVLEEFKKGIEGVKTKTAQLYNAQADALGTIRTEAGNVMAKVTELDASAKKVEKEFQLVAVHATDLKQLAHDTKAAQEAKQKQWDNNFVKFLGEPGTVKVSGLGNKSLNGLVAYFSEHLATALRY